MNIQASGRKRQVCIVAFNIRVLTPDLTATADMAASSATETDTTKPVADQYAGSSSSSESPSTVSTRRWIIISFWAVVALLGLPHWIWTTTTYRASLPIEDMNDWAAGVHMGWPYPTSINLRISGLHVGAGSQIFSAVYDKLSVDCPLPRQIELFSSPDDRHADLAVNVDVAENGSTDLRSSRLQPWATTLDLKYIVAGPVREDELAAWVAEQIRSVFEDEDHIISDQLAKTPFASKYPPPHVSAERQGQLDARSTRAFKYASNYHLTFSLFTPSNAPSAWEVEEALRQYLQPLITATSGISKFTVDTQVQLHAAFSPSIAGPQYDSATKEWRLQKSDLSGFVNAAEWPLSPSIGGGPTINFVLYVPSPAQSPLVVAETGGTSWLIPQWGGVAIFNPSEHRDILTVQDLEPVMLTFSDQLASLIGLPAQPKKSLALRLASLTRIRATELVLSTSDTLGALARLTLKLQNIAIPDTVAASVSSALEHLTAAKDDMQAGNYTEALAHARIANEEAEKAFFEPSMVGQVYFPDEHKVAVYVPLLGPMAVPLVMAALKEIRALRSRRKEKAT